jgi:hypothetical protein
VHLIAALEPALAAFDAQHIELAFDVAEDEVGAQQWDVSVQKSFAIVIFVTDWFVRVG